MGAGGSVTDSMKEGFNCFMTPLELSLSLPSDDFRISPGHTQVAVWLILEGAANDTNNHVDSAILREIDGLQQWDMLDTLVSLLNAHTTFISTIVAATSIAALPPNKSSSKTSHRSPLSMFQGFEEALLLQIADFAGVVRGRQLRNAREARECLGLLTDETGKRNTRQGGSNAH
jgi:hypothetical protein